MGIMAYSLLYEGAIVMLSNTFIALNIYAREEKSEEN